MWPPNPADFGHLEVSPGATTPRACRLRVGIAAKLSGGDVPGPSALRLARIPIRTLAVAATDDGRRARADAPGLVGW
ncbi:MAG: hypothetical protein ABSG56_35940 [Bryobacteraceae bacterium]